MKKLLALAGGLLLSVSALATVTYTPQAWRLYRSGVAQPGGYTSAAACDAALRAMPVNVGQTITFRCQQSTVARGVADPPVDCVVSEWGPWIPGEWSACANGQQSREETRERAVLVAPANGGAACPTLDEDRVVTQACSAPPPAGAVLFADDFEYQVNRLDSGASKTAAFLGRGYTGIKDETTRAGGAAGYLYTRTEAPGCGRPPSGSGRMLTMEGLATTLGHQTDFYLQLGNGVAGDIPAKVYIQFRVCMSRAGAEMSDLRTGHNKLLYPLYGSRTGYPMATVDEASLVTMSDTIFRGSSSIPAPAPGCFTFRNLAPASAAGARATIADQVAAGTGWMMTANTSAPGWICPNEWTDVRLLIDVAGPNGTYKAWTRPSGQGAFNLVADFTHGVTPGFTWDTAPLDRLGAKFLRIPTTWGPGSGTPGPDAWLNLDDLVLATSEDALP